MFETWGNQKSNTYKRDKIRKNSFIYNMSQRKNEESLRSQTATYRRRLHNHLFFGSIMANY